MRRLLLILALCALLLANGCSTSTPPAVAMPTSPVGMPVETDKLPIAPDTPRRATQLPRTVIDYDHALLTDSERQVVARLIEASKQIDEIFLRQVSEDNPSMRGRLAKQAAATSATPLDRAGYDYFIVNKGPWDRLKEDEPFVGTAKKPAGAAFYPGDMTKSELEQYVATHPKKKEELEGLFTIVRRDGTDFVGVPYHSVYRDFLEPAAKSLREAAALTNNTSLNSYLTKRADAFLSDDYRDSDMAWMDLNGPIEVVIGPYEVYEDNLFNYKAAYEAFVTVVDAPETAKLAAYARALPDMERNLPEPEQYKNMNRGTESPIRVVQEVYSAGDARHSVQTAAFNLPNDEVVREKKGSKKVLLKNVMDAKFRQSGRPIALRVLDPGFVTLPGGERVEARKPLKELFSTIEECKADVLGVWNLEYAQSHNLLTSFNERQLFATYAGLMSRTLRFGTGDAHGRGMAVQWNWLRERGAIVPAGTKFTVDFAKMRDGVKALATELLTIEATGDYNRAAALLAKYGHATPETDAVNRGLADIPIDFTPVFPAAGEK